MVNGGFLYIQEYEDSVELCICTYHENLFSTVAHIYLFYEENGFIPLYGFHEIEFIDLKL